MPRSRPHRPRTVAEARARLEAAVRARIADWPARYAPRLVGATRAEAHALFDELEAELDHVLQVEAARLGVTIDRGRPPLRLLS